MDDVWNELHLPVLRDVVELTDAGESIIRPEQIAARLGIDRPTVVNALYALAGEDPSFFRIIDGSSLAGRDIAGVKDPTGHARRTVGQWPTAETLADKIVAGLRDAAELEVDPEKAGWLKKTAIWLGGTGRDVAVNVAATAISRGAGI